MPRSEKKQKHPHGEEVRLQAFLAHAGIASRRAAEELIASGRVFVNGESVTAPGIKVRPGVDEVQVEGQPVVVQPITWIALHKPKGYVTTRDDQYGRKTVYDLLPERYHGLFHVGRLDRDSEGLILLTNDGTLANRMLHPSFGITKEYWADVEGKPTAEEMHRLTEGVEDEGETLKAESVRRLHQTGEHEHRMSIVLVEGKNREVRRMMEAVGHPVNRLIRRRFGPVALGELKPGKYRVVTDTELAGLRKKPSKAATSIAHGESRDESPGGDRPPRRATHGAYSQAPAEKKPASPAASAGKSRRNADEKGARPFAKTARGKPGRAAKPGRAGRRDDEQDSGSPRGTGAKGGPKKRGFGDRERLDRPRGTGKPTRRDDGETPRAAARGPVRRDEDAPRRAPVRRDEDAPRRGPVRRDDDDAPRRAPVRRGDGDVPRGAARGGRPGTPVRRPFGEDEAPVRRPPAKRAGGKPARRDDDGDTRRPGAGARGGKPVRRDEDAGAPRPSAGRGGPNRPPRRDDGDDSPRTPKARPGAGRTTRRDEGETGRPSPPKRTGGPSRGRQDEEERPERGAAAGRRTGQGGGDREMKAQWPQTGRPERASAREKDEGEAPRGGRAGGPRGGRPSGGDSPRGAKPGSGKPGGAGGGPGRGGDRPRSGGGGGRPGPRGGGKPGPRGGGKGGGGGGRGR
ncbi:MAG TPA: pseudouridine synthase [Longimicrobium sp.]|nr:pseudouridine synthase [Longimicrobium sp.]